MAVNGLASAGHEQHHQHDEHGERDEDRQSKISQNGEHQTDQADACEGKKHGFHSRFLDWLDDCEKLTDVCLESPDGARAQHLVEEKKEERPIERPSETIDDGTNDPGEQGNEDETDFESAEGHGG
jgi:hypothetical protein